VGRTAVLVCLAVALGISPAGAQDKGLYKPVDTADLARNLQKFWAIGVVFKDTLTALPAGQTVKISGKTYTRFATRIAGDCYLDAEAAQTLPAMKEGSSYLFTGTVIQKPSGTFVTKWFSGGPNYVIVIHKIMPALEDVKNLKDMMQQVSGRSADPDHQAVERMRTLFTGLDADVAAMAENRGVEMWEMFVLDSTNRPDVQSLVSQGLSSMADQTKLTPEALLAQFVLAVLATGYPPPPNTLEAKPVEDAAPPETESADIAPEKVKAPAAKPSVPSEQKKAGKRPDRAQEQTPKLRVRAIPVEAPAAETVSPIEKVEAAPVEEPATPATSGPATAEPELPPADVSHVERTLDEMTPENGPVAAPSPGETVPATNEAPAEIPSTDDLGPVPL
jgi:hypothetical protein